MPTFFSDCAVRVTVLSRAVLLEWRLSLGLCCWCSGSLSDCAVGVAALSLSLCALGVPVLSLGLCSWCAHALANCAVGTPSFSRAVQFELLLVGSAVWLALGPF